MSTMPSSYKKLAALRVNSVPDGYFQPESFGYDFKDWVSPYTKGACKLGGIAIVLQDWASESGLIPYNPSIQTLGHDPERITNQRLKDLLRNVLKTSLVETYATNIFPFVKRGTMSASLPQKLVNDTALTFTSKELAIANPKLVLALGKVAQRALSRIGIACVNLPHPAARGLKLSYLERVWHKAIETVV